MSMPVKRICIIGPSSSGKSTLAHKLGQKTGFPVLHLDKIAHIPGTNWKRCSLEETIQKHDTFIRKDRWIVEGNYQKFMAQRFERADTVIVHHFNRFGCAYRFVKRAMLKQTSRAGMLDGTQDKINWKMVYYILFKAPQKMKMYSELLKKYSHLNVIHVYSFKETGQLINEITKCPRTKK